MIATPWQQVKGGQLTRIDQKGFYGCESMAVSKEPHRCHVI